MNSKPIVNGVGEQVITLPFGSVPMPIGYPCALDNNGNVGVCNTARPNFIGRVASVSKDERYCGVQIKGYMELDSDPSGTFAYGPMYLVGHTTYLKPGSGSPNCLVIKIDQSENKIGIII